MSIIKINESELPSGQEAMDRFAEINGDIATLTSAVTTLEEDLLRLREEIRRDPRQIELKRIKVALKKCKQMRSSRTQEHIGILKIVYGRFHPEVSFTDRLMSMLTEANEEEAIAKLNPGRKAI